MEIEDCGCFFFSIIIIMNVLDIICYEYLGCINVSWNKENVYIYKGGY